MSSLKELVNTLADAQLREDLLDRLAIVEHKIKFVDNVPVCVLKTDGEPNLALGDVLTLAGVVTTTNAYEAAFVLFYEEEQQLDNLMATAPALIDAEWSASKYGRICLVADAYDLENPEDAITLVEDVAEMVHPGFFIFGGEGDKWVKFAL